MYKNSNLSPSPTQLLPSQPTCYDHFLLEILSSLAFCGGDCCYLQQQLCSPPVEQNPECLLGQPCTQLDFPASTPVKSGKMTTLLSVKHKCYGTRSSYRTRWVSKTARPSTGWKSSLRCSVATWASSSPSSSLLSCYKGTGCSEGGKKVKSARWDLWEISLKGKRTSFCSPALHQVPETCDSWGSSS